MKQLGNDNDENAILEKTLGIMPFIISFIVMILAFFQISGYNENLILIFEPLLGLQFLLMGTNTWKLNKKISICFLIVSLIIFICSIIIIIL